MHSHFCLVMVNEVNGGHYLSLRSAQKESELIKTNSRRREGGLHTKTRLIFKMHLLFHHLLSCYVNYKSVRK